MRFSDVQHQARALSLLRRALRSGRTHHAYLFDGPDGVGKEMTARALGARLLCEDASAAPDADACGTCRACRALAAGTHPDFHFVDRSLHKVHPDPAVRRSRGLFLAVAVIRTFLIEPSTGSPALGRRRVFIVRDAERMNEEAQNALLKTLEEPPGAATIMLVTSSADRLLSTIRSRCQRIPFAELPEAFVQERLTAEKMAPAEAGALAALCGGRLGVAQRWRKAGLLELLPTLDGLLVDRRYEHPESFAKELLEAASGVAQRLRSASSESSIVENDSASDEDEDAEDGEAGTGKRAASKTIPADELRDALKLTLTLFSALLRDALLLGTGATPRLVSRASSTAVLAKELDELAIADRLEAVMQSERLIDRNVAPQLACESLAIALGGEQIPVSF